MQGDKLASGAASAVFTGPRLKFDELEMQQDLHRLPAAAFQEKYMVTSREYELLVTSDGEQTNTLIREMQEHTEAIERLVAQEQKEDASLRRDHGFIHPFAAHGISGRVLCSRDLPAAQAVSKLALPRHLRKGKELLPSTGRILDADVISSEGMDAREQLIGKRIVFGGMSGTAVCFHSYPTFMILDVAEILALLDKDDPEIIEQELEPLT